MTPAVSRLAALALVAPGAFAADQAQVDLQKEGLQLIQQLKETARDIRYHAERLESFSNSVQVSKWTHYHHLTEIKGLVNEGLQPALARLCEIQPQLASWKQEAINNLLDAAKSLSADAHSAILSKNDAGVVPPYMNAEYKDLVSKIYQHADRLFKTSDTATNYANNQLKAAPPKK
jgi:hypothetical protein